MTDAAEVIKAVAFSGLWAVGVALVSLFCLCFIALGVVYALGWRPGEGDYPHEHGDGDLP